MQPPPVSSLGVALRYHCEALAGLRQVLDDITPSTCVAIFACSVMIVICAIVSPLLPAGPNDEVKSTARSMLPIVDLPKGISSIINISQQWLF
jgi:hypothetical protein